MTNIESRLSTLAKQIQGSITMEVTALANQLKAEGKPVIGMSAGEPDFDTPDFIKDAAVQALKDGQTKYTAAAGLPVLKSLVAKRIKEERGIEYTPDQIVISCGAKHSIFNALSAVINPGDEVIFSSPYWVSYPDQVKMLGGVPVIIETTDATSFKITPDQLRNAITDKTKVCIINSPSNPTGVVYTPDELKALADVIVEKDILVISDEIYAKLVYEGEHVSIGSFNDEIKARTIFIDGMSKAYSMTGWRIGYLAAPKEIASTVSRLQSHSTSNPTTPSQYASIAALEGDDAAVETMKAAFDERRKIMASKLNAIDGVTCVVPQGAFYAFPNISALFGSVTPEGAEIVDSVSFCKAFLQEKLVACVPGSGFGAEGYIRLSYATSNQAIEDAIGRLSEFVASLTRTAVTS